MNVNGTSWSLPFEPLAPFLEHLNDFEAADLVGVCRETVNRWRNGRQPIRVDLADRAALALGLHPVMVWGDLW